jgi:DNA-binding NtrC family response regulator
MAKILIWNRYPDWELLAEKLAHEGHTIVWADKPEWIRQGIATSRPALVVFNSRKNGPIRWDVLEEMKRQEPHLPVLVILDPAHPPKDNRLSLADAWVTRDSPYEEFQQKIDELLPECLSMKAH